MRRLTRLRHRRPAQRARRARKLERRTNRRLLRLVEGSNLKRVRRRHEAGHRALEALFDGPARWFVARYVSDQTGRGRPVRLRPGVPPVRDDEHQAKHRRRKAQRAARRRSR